MLVDIDETGAMAGIFFFPTIRIIQLLWICICLNLAWKGSENCPSQYTFPSNYCYMAAFEMEKLVPAHYVEVYAQMFGH